jgi:hypothetical protein
MHDFLSNKPVKGTQCHAFDLKVTGQLTVDSNRLEHNLLLVFQNWRLESRTSRNKKTKPNRLVLHATGKTPSSCQKRLVYWRLSYQLQSISWLSWHSPTQQKKGQESCVKMSRRQWIAGGWKVNNGFKLRLINTGMLQIKWSLKPISY